MENPNPTQPTPSTQPPAEEPNPAQMPVAPPSDSKIAHNRLIVIGVVVAILLVAAGGIWAMGGRGNKTVTKNTDTRIKVGFMMPLSGAAAFGGEGGLKGIKLAQKQLQADNIEIVQVDTKCEPKAAVEGIKKLTVQKVVAIIGDMCSSSSTAALPLANNNKIPMVSPSASSPKLSIADDYFFRVVPPDDIQGGFLAQTIIPESEMAETSFVKLNKNTATTSSESLTPFGTISHCPTVRVKFSSS